MIAVLFEVRIAPSRRQDYLDLAAELRPLLEQVDGFLSVERFQSLTDPDKLLSLSFFRDEEAVRSWRNLSRHRSAQQPGQGRHICRLPPAGGRRFSATTACSNEMKRPATARQCMGERRLPAARRPTGRNRADTGTGRGDYSAFRRSRLAVLSAASVKPKS